MLLDNCSSCSAKSEVKWCKMKTRKALGVTGHGSGRRGEMLIVGSEKGEQIQEVVKGWNQLGNFLSEKRRIYM